MTERRRTSADAQLVRAIGTRQLTASIINVTIASSIFLMPATVAERLGAAAPIAYLVCATLMSLIAFSTIIWYLKSRNELQSMLFVLAAAMLNSDTA